LNEVEFSATVHLSFHELELGDLPFDLSVGSWPEIAAQTADLSFVMPLAKEAIRLRPASAIHRSSRWRHSSAPLQQPELHL
jgi:hypothetical protein